MKKFETALDVQFIDGKTWLVIEDFYYDTEIKLAIYKTCDTACNGVRGWGPPLFRIKVPAGFETDFASIPRVLWSILPPAGAYGKAAVLHDYLYRTAGLATRGEADAVLKEAMQVSGVGWFTRQTIYWGVRTGGHWAYRGGL